MHKSFTIKFFWTFLQCSLYAMFLLQNFVTKVTKFIINKLRNKLYTILELFDSFIILYAPSLLVIINKNYI